MKEFIINKTMFGNDIIYNSNHGTFKVCTVMFLKDMRTLEVRYPFTAKRDVDIPILAEIKMEKDRNTKILYHHINGTESILNYIDIDDMKELRAGKTPRSIQEVLGKGKKKYLEVYSTLKSEHRTFYFSVRLMKENRLDEDKNVIIDEYVNYFMISCSLYDPKYKDKDDELFQPLQMIYSDKVYLDDLELI